MTENDQTDDREMELIVEKEILVMKCAVWQGEWGEKSDSSETDRMEGGDEVSRKSDLGQTKASG